MRPDRPLLLAALLALGMHAFAAAAEVQVAVASNFMAPMKEIAAAFAADSGHRAVLNCGATGKFHAQIGKGAPFELLLAADERVPRQLETEGLAVRGTRFTYALGRLALWSPKPGHVDGAQALQRPDVAHVAIANPRSAPYGAAAVQVLGKLGLLPALTPKLVQGENIAQAHQYVGTGNAQLGFVAVSQVYRDGKLVSGSGWMVPATLHEPIRQDAVMLAKGSANPAAGALARYLRSDRARAIMRTYGYEH